MRKLEIFGVVSQKKKEEENPSQNDSKEMMSIQLEVRGGEDEFEA